MAIFKRRKNTSTSEKAFRDDVYKRNQKRMSLKDAKEVNTYPNEQSQLMLEGDEDWSYTYPFELDPAVAIATQTNPQKMYSQGQQFGKYVVNKRDEKGLPLVAASVAVPLTAMGLAEGGAWAFANPTKFGSALLPLLGGATVDKGVRTFTPYKSFGNAVYNVSGLSKAKTFKPEETQAALEFLNPGFYLAGPAMKGVTYISDLSSNLFKSKPFTPYFTESTKSPYITSSEYFKPVITMCGH